MLTPCWCREIRPCLGLFLESWVNVAVLPASHDGDASGGKEGRGASSAKTAEDDNHGAAGQGGKWGDGSSEGTSGDNADARLTTGPANMAAGVLQALPPILEQELSKVSHAVRANFQQQFDKMNDQMAEAIAKATASTHAGTNASETGASQSPKPARAHPGARLDAVLDVRGSSSATGPYADVARSTSRATDSVPTAQAS